VKEGTWPLASKQELASFQKTVELEAKCGIFERNLIICGETAQLEAECAKISKFTSELRNLGRNLPFSEKIGESAEFQ